jgi:nucleoside-diphosphate-sugar epimerase
MANDSFHSCVQTGFFGIDAKSHSAKVWDDGNKKFSVTNMDDIGLAVANILSKPDETANKTVYISSFEPSLNDLLAAYKEATGVSEWNIAHGEVEQGIKDAQETSKTATAFMDKMRAMGLLGLLVGLTKDAGADFVAEGLSDNDLLEIPRGNVTESVKKNLQL